MLEHCTSNQRKKLIIEAGLEGNMLLRSAAKVGHVELARALLEHNVGKEASYLSTGMPLHFAASNGHAEIVKMLLEKGARQDAVNGFGVTPLHMAVQMDRVEIVGILLGKGAKTEVATNYRQTALHWAACWGSGKIVNCCLKKELGSTLRILMDTRLCITHISCKTSKQSRYCKKRKLKGNLSPKD